MRTWASEDLKAAWEIIAGSDFDINNIEYLYVKTSDLIDLRDAIRVANTELTTALRQRDAALAACKLAKAWLGDTRDDTGPWYDAINGVIEELDKVISHNSRNGG